MAAVGEKGIETFYWEPAWVLVDDISLMKSGELPETPAPAVSVKKVTLSSVKNQKTNKVVVKWKKLSGVSGYQIA